MSRLHTAAGAALALGLTLALALALALVPGAAAASPAGPALSVAAADLEAALDCPDAFTDADHEPLLLVHGTYATPEENWGWNYARVLPEQGWDVCMVTLPDRSLGDIQVQAEYVVHAIRAIASRSGEQVDVMGHSQGGLQPRWAVKWWPDVRAAVDDLVTLATPNHGTLPAAGGEALGTGCHASCMQMRPESDFVTALNRDDETPGDISYTSVYSLTDELVQPAAPEATAALDGASNVLMQELCPGRPVEHLQFAVDAAVHAVVLDALTEDGSFDPARWDLAACAGAFVADGDAELMLGLMEASEPPVGFFDAGDEPPLMPYTQDGGGSDAKGEGGEQPSGESGGASGSDGSGAEVLSASAGDGAPSVAGGDGPLPATGGPGFGAAGLALLGAARLVRRRLHA